MSSAPYDSVVTLLDFFSGNESLPVDTENPDAWRLDSTQFGA